jgi:peptide/nickel transport system ATP-binding protein
MTDGVPLVELTHVTKRFGERPAGVLGRLVQRLGLAAAPAVTRAVDDVSLAIQPGEVVGLAGESGCGKSTLGRIVAALLPPNEGEVRIGGQTIEAMTSAQRRAARLRIQMVFQDPYASLNPRLRVRDIVGEAPMIHGLVTRGELDEYVCAQLERTGLDPSVRHRYPHQFSGGQRQRVGIARALAVRPSMLVCDEAVAAVDVSIQAQILNLFMELRDRLNLTYLFISHDLGVVEHVSDRAMIMYLGSVVETARVEDVFNRPNHPYTQALLAEIPRLTHRHRMFSAIQGEIPSPLRPPPGCRFHPRCPHAMLRCKTEVPALRGVAAQHLSACHLNDKG